jgi:SHS family lactate transporter-like MFS transporter
MQAWRLFTSLNREQRNTFTASFLGWTLDAFDFFLLSFVQLKLAKDFGVPLPAIALTVTLTLAMRPLGALIFGLLAERFGRRILLMVDIIFFSIMELLTAFSPNYTTFLIFRILFGIGMGGEWGLGSSLTMETLPTEARGLFSGILQQGYAFGYLLATLVFFGVFNIPAIASWRTLFIIGVIPALLVVFIRSKVPESPIWEQRQALHSQTGTSVWKGIGTAIGRRPFLFIYVIILMTAFNCLSHGTQDNYPTFLQAQLALNTNGTTLVSVIANVGAIIGGTLFGYYSQSWGRRRAIIVACVIGLFMIPLWSGLLRIPGVSLLITLPVGAFLLQFMVQGAWGVIPVHLNELSPTDVRGTFPGFAYQLGNLIASFVIYLQATIAIQNGSKTVPNYSFALTTFTVGAFIAVILFTAIGKEAHGIEFTEVAKQEILS